MRMENRMVRKPYIAEPRQTATTYGCEYPSARVSLPKPRATRTATSAVAKNGDQRIADPTVAKFLRRPVSVTGSMNVLLKRVDRATPASKKCRYSLSNDTSRSNHSE